MNAQRTDPGQVAAILAEHRFDWPTSCACGWRSVIVADAADGYGVSVLVQYEAHLAAALSTAPAQQDAGQVPAPDRDGLVKVLSEHEPVLGRFGNMCGIVGCSCLSARDYRAAGFSAGQEGWRAHIASALAGWRPPTEPTAEEWSEFHERMGAAGYTRGHLDGCLVEYPLGCHGIDCACPCHAEPTAEPLTDCCQVCESAAKGLPVPCDPDGEPIHGEVPTAERAGDADDETAARLAAVEALLNKWRSLPVWGPDERGLMILDGVDRDGLLNELRAALEYDRATP